MDLPMTLADFTHTPDSGIQRCLEIAVPLVSFGFTLGGILLWQGGIKIDFQYFAIGCLIGSCILAYLAWIRPHKDIVALSTPLYGLIFFVVPTEFDAGVALQLLYAVSLTFLLMRLKYRFGNAAPLPGSAVQEGPLDRYIDLVRESLPLKDPESARNATHVFVRFAEGDYDNAARLASRDPGGTVPGRSDTLSRAFAIVAEQAAHTKTGGAFPPDFVRFVPEDGPFLFHPAEAGMDEEQEYMAALDNALLLLYAAGFTSQDAFGKDTLHKLRHFAQKLSGE
jgi:hypothetical protein